MEESKAVNHIIESFGYTTVNITNGIVGSLKEVEKAFKSLDANDSDRIRISKRILYMANQLEQEAERWLHMK